MKDEKNTNAAAETAEEEKKKVLTYFKPSEIEALKKNTGADKEGTAIAAFVRKQLAACGAND